MSSQTTSCRIEFKDGQAPQEFAIESDSDANPWRFLTKDGAVVLVPVCDHCGRVVDRPPLFQHFEAWPVSLHYPASLITDHQEEVERMRRDHLAGKHECDGNLSFDDWLKAYGLRDLWLAHATEEMQRRHLPPDDLNGPCFLLSLWALAGEKDKECIDTDGKRTPHVDYQALERIRFRADFHNGDLSQTIYLEACNLKPLTTEERKLSPAWLEREERRLRKAVVVETTRQKNLEAERQAAETKLKLTVQQRKLETERTARQKEDERLDKQRAKEPVTDAEVLAAFKSRSKESVQKRCRQLGVAYPETKAQLALALAKHKRKLGSWKRNVRSATQQRKAERLGTSSQSGPRYGSGNEWFDERYGG